MAALDKGKSLGGLKEVSIAGAITKPQRIDRETESKKVRVTERQCEIVTITCGY